jgi:tetratricopeptide (TPR) repeat protein
LWARSYEQSSSGILTMQQEVASAIANEIQVELTPQHQQRLAALQLTDPRAAEAYARGRYFWNKRTDADLATAIHYFEQVLHYEPRYALAYSGLADAYFYRSYAFGNMPPREGMPKARAAAIKAVELDPDLAEAHTSMALVKLFYDWDWAGAEAEFKRAIQLNPNYPTAHHGYAVLLLTVYGRWDEAIVEADRALELDPLSVPLNNIVALILTYSPQHDQAIERARKLEELSPGNPTPYAYMSGAYEAKGLFREAADASLKGHALDGTPPRDLARLSQVYEQGGINAYRRLEAEIVIEKAKMHAPESVLDRLSLAQAYAHIGDNDAALAILENICDERSGMAIWSKIDFANIPNLRDSSRFQQLLRRMGLPD